MTNRSIKGLKGLSLECFSIERNRRGADEHLSCLPVVGACARKNKYVCANLTRIAHAFLRHNERSHLTMCALELLPSTTSAECHRYWKRRYLESYERLWL